jgi:hypothetical protein
MVAARDLRLASNRNPLHLVETHFIVPAIVKLRGPVEAWFAIAAAFSSVPPFFRYAVMPVARNV